jgi:Domain of unknown function DUF29
MKIADLYDTDFAEWTRQNAELLRSGRASEADLAHIAEEIEDMGKRERRSLYHRLIRLIEHLLKWQYQSERRGASWQRTIIIQRREIRELLDENPSFRPELDRIVLQAYQGAVAAVAVVISRPRDEFPAACPYTFDQLLDEDFLP